MSSTSNLRGHPIFCRDGEWLYVDTSLPIAGKDRPCGHCGKERTKEGHDGCLGTLPGVMNACCGHGVVNDAYVQFSPTKRVGHEEAIDAINRLRDS